MLVPNPLKTRCSQCGKRPMFRDGSPDSDFFSCKCKGGNGGYKYVTYAGWTKLPIQWKPDFTYKIKFKIAKLLLTFLKLE